MEHEARIWRIMAIAMIVLFLALAVYFNLVIYDYNNMREKAREGALWQNIKLALDGNSTDTPMDMCILSDKEIICVGDCATGRLVMGNDGYAIVRGDAFAECGKSAK